jgi:hypothetical protein
MADAAPLSPEVQSLLVTRASMKAHLAARDSRKAGQGPDYAVVTRQEQMRLAEVEGRLAKFNFDFAAFDKALAEAAAEQPA